LCTQQPEEQVELCGLILEKGELRVPSLGALRRGPVTHTTVPGGGVQEWAEALLREAGGPSAEMSGCHIQAGLTHMATHVNSPGQEKGYCLQPKEPVPLPEKEERGARG
jgi:hypothetical protein